MGAKKLSKVILNQNAWQASFASFFLSVDEHTSWRHEEGDGLQDVQIDLMLAVLDVLATPANLTGDLAGNLLGLLALLHIGRGEKDTVGNGKQ